MLLTMRVPVVDLRALSFSGYPRDVRLPATWSENEDFVRYFGPVTKRVKGPVDPWTPERAFCQYDRVLRFPPSYPGLLARDAPGLEFFGIKRRLYPATTRNDLFHVDLQIVGRPGRPEGSWSRPGSPSRPSEPVRIDLVATVTAVLNAPTTVRSPGGSVRSQPAGKMGPPLARALDAATTVGGPSGRVTAGASAVAIEVDERDIVSSAWLEEWDIGDGLRLAARTVAFAGREVNVFLVKRPARFDRDRARELRVHVLRLHSEREYLRRLARLLSVEGFIEGCEHAQAERVQDALNQCLAALTRAARYGFSAAEIRAAFAADRTLSGAELEVLTERIQRFRPVIGKRLKRLNELEDASEERWRDLFERNPNQRIPIYIRELNMAKYDQRGSQIGAAGDKASATNFSFGGQLNLGEMSAADAEALRSALQTLRRHLAEQLLAESVIEVGSEAISPTQIGDAIGALSEAEAAVSARDEQRAQGALRRSGRWLASFAQQVGAELAAAAIRGALGLP